MRFLRSFVTAWAWFVVVIYVSALSWIIISFGASLNDNTEIVDFFQKVLVSYGMTVILCTPMALLCRLGASVVYARVQRSKKVKAVHPTPLSTYPRLLSVKRTLVVRKSSQSKDNAEKRGSTISADR